MPVIQYPRKIDSEKKSSFEFLSNGREPERKYKTNEEFKEMSSFLSIKKKHENGFPSNKERLEALLEMMEEATGAMEGVFKTRPTQGQAYALTNLANQMQSLMSQIDQAYNFKELSDKVIKRAVNPSIEQLLIFLSKRINECVKSLDIKPSARKEIKASLSEVLKDFAVETEKSIITIGENVTEVLTDK